MLLTIALVGARAVVTSDAGQLTVLRLVLALTATREMLAFVSQVFFPRFVGA